MPYTFTAAEAASGYSFAEYLELTATLVAQGRTTGPEQSPKLAEYTKLNLARMRRLHAHTPLLPATEAALGGLKQRWLWVALTEAWCGDAAQNLPTLARMAEQSGGRITLRLLLRDEHPAIMDHYLTNGGRSIPKLICLQLPDEGGESNFLLELGTWGPRPGPAQALVEAHKANPSESKEVFIRRVHEWYTDDDTRTLQAEFQALLPLWQAAGENPLPPVQEGWAPSN